VEEHYELLMKSLKESTSRYFFSPCLFHSLPWFARRPDGVIRSEPSAQKIHVEGWAFEVQRCDRVDEAEQSLGEVELTVLLSIPYWRPFDEPQVPYTCIGAETFDAMHVGKLCFVRQTDPTLGPVRWVPFVVLSRDEDELRVFEVYGEEGILGNGEHYAAGPTQCSDNDGALAGELMVRRSGVPPGRSYHVTVALEPIGCFVGLPVGENARQLWCGRGSHFIEAIFRFWGPSLW
jgi:hypothetical protein